MDPETWLESREYTSEQLAHARKILEEIKRGREVWQAMRRYPLPSGGYVAKHVLVAAYHNLVDSGEWKEDPALLASIRMKPIRTLSGVTTVTVLTKEYPCPANCIFCPTEARMPKSYLSDEPGARRAVQHGFDPFEQVASRIQALEAVGHPTEKIELLILGGTWSAYQRDYQEWFVRRCFDALNEVESETLIEAQHRNESAAHRNVGLVIETRPDRINPHELAWLRHLGVTKVQMGAQSLDDRILLLNRRGHTVEQTLKATALLRAAAFKVVLHWMPNLYGATLESDHTDFSRLWTDGFAPDEIKIYPTQLLRNTDLYTIWENGKYHPYTQEELVGLIADLKPEIPRYCRVDRVIRDIPSTNVVAGNKRTSLRQDVQEELARRGNRCNCIRCREVRKESIHADQLRLDDLVYHPANAEEHFLSFVTPQDHIAGYLRLSLPDETGLLPGMDDLRQAALIREVHVYGQSLPVGSEQAGAAQHIGLGTQLIEKAAQIAREHGFERLAVIAAIGTRAYYRERGFVDGELYLVRELAEIPSQA